MRYQLCVAGSSREQNTATQEERFDLAFAGLQRRRLGLGYSSLGELVFFFRFACKI